MDKPLISIVTISYNAETEIEKTIESVLSQTFDCFEYVCVDGNSKDKTMEIIESYRESFKKRNIPFHVLSEPDTGIYDAMNKGIVETSGEWVNYMNAGDCFLDENVLSEIFVDRQYDSTVLYGEVVLSDGGYYKKHKCGSIDQLNETMPFSHQSAFVKREVLNEYRFKTEYKIAGDYDLFLRLYVGKKKFSFVDRIIAVYDMSGVSENNLSSARMEDYLIRKCSSVETKHSFLYTNIYQNYIVWRRTLVKKIWPRLYYSEKRGWYKQLEVFRMK